MATFNVCAGIGKALPEAQVVLIGRHKWISELKFDNQLADKLNGVNDTLFNQAIKQLQPGSSVPLYLNYAKVIFIS
jgi:hypothetical protein